MVSILYYEHLEGKHFFFILTDIIERNLLIFVLHPLLLMPIYHVYLCETQFQEGSKI